MGMFGSIKEASDEGVSKIEGFAELVQLCLPEWPWKRKLEGLRMKFEANAPRYEC